MAHPALLVCVCVCVVYAPRQISWGYRVQKCHGEDCVDWYRTHTHITGVDVHAMAAGKKSYLKNPKCVSAVRMSGACVYAGTKGKEGKYGFCFHPFNTGMHSILYIFCRRSLSLLHPNWMCWLASFRLNNVFNLVGPKNVRSFRPPGGIRCRRHRRTMRYCAGDWKARERERAWQQRTIAVRTQIDENNISLFAAV